MKIGSPAHKELFCRCFLEGHRRYEPESLPWPALDGEPLALLQSLPFWTFALQAEADAGPMISACAALERDPLVREALQLQADEETRHAGILRHMITRYALQADEPKVEIPTDAIEAFIDFGFEECFDSFGAFGLFQLAREHALVPTALFDIFEHVMEEEARHIVFFINWFAHRQVNQGRVARVLRQPKALWHYGKALRKLVDLVRDDDAPEGQDFIVSGASAFIDDLTPALVLSRCLAENERRLAGVDRRLLVPRLGPAVADLALRVLERLPERWSGARRPDRVPQDRVNVAPAHPS
jgi:hypothetical protein